jgi:hypothetical protein
LVESAHDSAFRRSACLNCCAKLAFTRLNWAESCAEVTHILPLNAAEVLQAHTDMTAPPNNCDRTQVPRSEPPHSRPRASRAQLGGGGGAGFEGEREHATVTNCDEVADTLLAGWQVALGKKGAEVGWPRHEDLPMPWDQIARCTPEELQSITLDHDSGRDALLNSVAEQVLEERGTAGAGAEELQEVSEW